MENYFVLYEQYSTVLDNDIQYAILVKYQYISLDIVFSFPVDLDKLFTISFVIIFVYYLVHSASH